ncbi:oxidoreductase [Corynebacterium macginleyi]|uniref:oxidoreductase n=1 Tax=Corynebacterium macginleyi TaxID=38290 RepID=UPI00190E3789|nr:oxidoreductase [Corynebacterium macginleyi]MBK4151854.1 oxidoreductase [Corynebacterium macginleyi]
MYMSENDALSPLFRLPGVQEGAEKAAAAIARAHRRPAGLRRYEVISAESLMRGARASVALDGYAIPPHPGPGDVKSGPLAGAVSAYSMAAPEVVNSTVRTFARAPLQVFARIDVAAGGNGIPSGDSARLQGLACLIAQGSGPAFRDLLPSVVHAEIAAGEFFGPRSGVVARVAARLAAMHTGFDPRGFAVPEVYFHRHSKAYQQCRANYRDRPGEVVLFHLAAWAVGGKEADAIARAA